MVARMTFGRKEPFRKRQQHLRIIGDAARKGMRRLCSRRMTKIVRFSVTVMGLNYGIAGQSGRDLQRDDYFWARHEVAAQRGRDRGRIVLAPCNRTPWLTHASGECQGSGFGYCAIKRSECWQWKNRRETPATSSRPSTIFSPTSGRRAIRLDFKPWASHRRLHA